jgi:vancomycin resistance protein YoaR
MDATKSLGKHKPNTLTVLTRLLAASFTAVCTMLFAAFVFLVGTRLVYIQRVLPGTTLQGFPLTGMKHEQIVASLEDRLTYPEQGTLVLTDADLTWMMRPTEFGVLVDFDAIAEKALSVGRSGTLFERLGQQIDAWYQGVHLSPILQFDYVVGQYRLGQIAAIIDRPTIEASLQVEGVSVRATPGQIGRSVDLEATLEALKPNITQMVDAVIPLIITEVPPKILDATEAAWIGQRLLGEPLKITAEGAEDLVLPPETVATLLRFEIEELDTGVQYRVALDPQALIAALEPLAPDLERDPENARFIFNDDTGQLDLLESAVIGRALDLQASIEEINDKVARGEHIIPLAFQYEDPVVGDKATSEELGISEAVSVVSTYFYGSSTERVQNIRTASSAFHGLLLAPGETLSMAEVLGDISLDSGYAEALIIFGDKTIKGVGGGVCQVSTTLFRAVFFGGYEIVERHPHAYRVGYYEQGPGSPGPGLDATVFVPLVDFKFRNDTPYWLLLETYVYGNQLLWKFYSTSDGRTVQWSKKLSNEVEAPKPLYKENPDLEKGKIEQIDYEADGLDVVVYRTVTRGDEGLYQDTIKTHYLPWRAIYEFGSGTDLPDDVEVENADD